MRILGKILYWVAVLIVSVALLIALIVLIESRDRSTVEGSTLDRSLAI